MSIRFRLLFPIMALVLAGCDVDMLPHQFWDAETKTGDLARFLGVQQADAVATGSPVLGEAGALGATGRPSVSLRVIRTGRSTPSVGGTVVSTTGHESSTFPTDDGAVNAVSVDAGVSVWRGFRAGRMRVAGITLLGGLSTLPGFGESDLDIRGGGGLVVAFGTRLGIMEETDRHPGISVTTTWRKLPQFSLGPQPMPTDDGGTMSISLSDVSGQVVQSRLAASKTFGRFGVIAGIGRDHYSAHGDLELRLTSPGNQGVELAERSSSVDRTVLFAGATWRVGRTIIGAEVGRTGGIDSQESPVNNRFEGRSDWSRTYLSVGARLGP